MNGKTYMISYEVEVGEDLKDLGSIIAENIDERYGYEYLKTSIINKYGAKAANAVVKSYSIKDITNLANSNSKN